MSSDLFTAPPGDPAAALAQLQRQLDDLARAMQLAQATGQEAALAQFRVQFQALSARAASLRAALSASEQPPAVLQALDRLGDALAATGRQLGADVTAVVRGVPRVLVALAVLAGVALVWWLVARFGRRRS